MSRPRDTYPANELVRVRFSDDVNHWVGAVQPPHARAVFYPLTFPELRTSDDPKRPPVLRSVRSLMEYWLVADVYLGTLPVVALDQHMARALAENWSAAVRNGEVDPGKRDSVLAWADLANRRVPTRTRLIGQVQWPPGLPLTHFHEN